MLKRLGAALIVLVLACGYALAASSTLSGLSAGTTITDGDLLYDVQSSGSGGVKITASQLATYLISKGAGGINKTTVTLSASQIANATTTPVQIVPAQGSGSIILLAAPVVYEWIFNSAQFTAGSPAAGLFWSDGTAPNSLAVDQGDFACPEITQTAFCVSPAQSNSTSTIGATLIPNRGLYYVNFGDAYSGGNGTMKVIVTWTTVAQ